MGWGRFFFFQAEDGIRDRLVTGVQTCALPISYSNQRFLAAREVFESILDEHPGHVETILNLGVVHMKNDEIGLATGSFNDAIVIRGEFLPFAHFMLGVCNYKLAQREPPGEERQKLERKSVV